MSLLFHNHYFSCFLIPESSLQSDFSNDQIGVHRQLTFANNWLSDLSLYLSLMMMLMQYNSLNHSDLFLVYLDFSLITLFSAIYQKYVLMHLYFLQNSHLHYAFPFLLCDIFWYSSAHLSLVLVIGV